MKSEKLEGLGGLVDSVSMESFKMSIKFNTHCFSATTELLQLTQENIIPVERSYKGYVRRIHFLKIFIYCTNTIKMLA